MGKGVKGGKSSKVEKERRSDQKREALASKRAERQERKRQRKERCKHNDDEDRQFRAQLQACGLRILEVDADGNCLFRSLCDQLPGYRPRDHAAVRRAIMAHEEVASDQYKWFVEDDEPWDDYLARLRRESEWGGNIELVAAANHFSCDVVVHQLGAPRLEIRADASSGATRTLHLSYHGESHYNSVRRADDRGGGGDDDDAPENLPRLDAPGGSARAAAGRGEASSDRQEADTAWPSASDAAAAVVASVGSAVDYLVGPDAPEKPEKKPSTRSGPCPCGSGRRYKKCCRAADLARERRAKQGDDAPSAAADLAPALASIRI